MALLIIHERSRTSTAPSAFPADDVSGKVWSTLISTQQAGIYPQKLAWLHYVPCKLFGANILAHCTTCVQPVRITL